MQLRRQILPSNTKTWCDAAHMLIRPFAADVINRLEGILRPLAEEYINKNGVHMLAFVVASTQIMSTRSSHRSE